jgi:hypothetical protein
MNGMRIARLSFTGRSVDTAALVLRPGLNVLYGASNTGKSFTLKAIDFLLGGARTLPEIQEREGYERGWLAASLPKAGDVTLMRALAGGAFELHPGHVSVAGNSPPEVHQLSAKHDHTNPDNVSQFLLDEIGFASKFIAVDVNGKKRSLSFRDLARFCLVDETAIQSETSPAESGQYQFATAERSVFKLLITGVDDSAILPVLDAKSFRTATTAKLEVVDDMLRSIIDELKADYPNVEQLPEQGQRLQATLDAVQRDVQAAQESIRERLAHKRRLADGISDVQQRLVDIGINLERFEQLEAVYRSDIERLEAIEEAGFLLTAGGDKDCPLCGARPEAQRKVHGLTDIERARDAARAEIAKIARQRVDLSATIGELQNETESRERQLGELDASLRGVEEELNAVAPAADAARRRLDEVLAVRDRVQRGLALLEQQRSLQTRRDGLAALKPATKAEKPRLGVPATAAHDFAQTVSRVLTEWQFPGNGHVAFDDAMYDVRIDGKPRRDNGKGVRAITHAAFKVALLIFCRERNLPHPGFLILDTPLLTYRDPLHSSAGPLTPDEQILKSSSLKDHFFAHLSRTGALAQIVVIENVDLPPGIEGLAHVETFTGDPANGRGGLFLPRRTEAP